MIQGENICIRVITEADLPLLDAWENDFAYNSEYNTFGLRRAGSRDKRFAEDGLINASTDITNRAEQRSLEKAGFTRDGVMRQAQWRNGSWHDIAVYSKLRGE